MSQHDQPQPRTDGATGSADVLLADTAANPRGAPDRSLPEQIGEFRILGLLGRGGMGAVYLAEQQNPQREVALKVLRGTQDDPGALRRFELEGEALALLDHPNIAHVFATGVDSGHGAGIPFLAMELVRGRNLLADADARALDADARVRLMVEVCHGVQHAHQRGVIHRDLKPANILVDTEGRPKIMDFGIARVLGAGSDGATRLTEAGQVVGTIPYMSPEQLRGESHRIDVRTDVFALGVILYELLAGRRPRELDASSLFSAIKSAERKPMVPLAKIVPKFGGDLDTIVMKALAESPSQRYASVADLAADLERYLDHRPILARAPSALYIARKFARRHRALVTAAAIAVLALLAATAFALVSAQKEREARAIAESKTAVANAVNDFTKQMLRGASAFSNQGKPVAVVDLLKAAERALDGKLASQPLVAGEVALLLGDAYRTLGQYDDALAMSKRAIASLPTSAEHASAKAEAILVHVAALTSTDRNDEASRELESELPPVEAFLSSRDPMRVEAIRYRAKVAERGGDQAEARRLLESALSAHTLGASSDTLRSVRQDMALLLRDLGNADDARSQMEELLRESTVSGNELQIQEDQNNLGTLLHRMDELDRAHELLSAAFQSSVKIFGRNHPSTLTTLLNLLNVTVKQGNLDAADRMSLDLLSRLDAGIGRATYLGQSILNTRAYLLDDLQRNAEAETLFREVLRLVEDNPSLRGQESIGNRNNLAMLLMEMERFEEAATEFERGIDEAVSMVGAEHPYVAIFRNNYGECLTKLGRYDEALAELRASHEGLVSTFGAEHERVKKSLARIALAEQRGR